MQFLETWGIPVQPQPNTCPRFLTASTTMGRRLHCIKRTCYCVGAPSETRRQSWALSSMQVVKGTLRCVLWWYVGSSCGIPWSFLHLHYSSNYTSCMSIVETHWRNFAKWEKYKGVKAKILSRRPQGGILTFFCQFLSPWLLHVSDWSPTLMFQLCLSHQCY